MRHALWVVWGVALAGAAGGEPRQAAGGAAPGRQEGEGDPQSGTVALPAAGYTPETSVAVAVFAMRYFRVGASRADERASSVSAALVYTLRNQGLVVLRPELWLDAERWRLEGELTYQHSPSDYYGVGNQTALHAAETYELEAVRHRADVARRVAPHLYVGVGQDAQAARFSDLEAGGLLSRGEEQGRLGGWTSGLGMSATWDTRDDTFATAGGTFAKVFFTAFLRPLGSDDSFTRVVADVRQFVTLKPGHVLGAQLWAELNTGRPPLDRLALLGGPNRMRGYNEGRFRDRNLLTLQVEYRVHVVWRFGVALFAAVGEVFHDIADMRTDALHASFGGGLRFALSSEERVHLRLDYGRGADSGALYLVVSEAF